MSLAPRGQGGERDTIDWDPDREEGLEVILPGYHGLAGAVGQHGDRRGHSISIRHAIIDNRLSLIIETRFSIVDYLCIVFSGFRNSIIDSRLSMHCVFGL